MGFRTLAVGRGPDKQGLAHKLGAHEYIDSATTNPTEALRKLGGARVILATAPDGKAMSALIDGLSPDGKMMVIGVGQDPISVSTVQLIVTRRGIQGWPSGSAIDSEDTLNFSVLTGVRPMIEKYPLVKAADAFAQMMSGKTRFRAVLTMN